MAKTKDDPPKRIWMDAGTTEAYDRPMTGDTEYLRGDIADGLRDACELLAELFPEDDIDSMDAADFKDRACQIMGIVLKAKAALAQGS